MQRSTRTVLAAQYTGTAESAADVLAMCRTITQYSGNEWSIESDDGTTLVLLETGPSLTARWPVLAGQYVIAAPDTGIIGRISAAAYAARYRPLETIIADAVAANVGAIAASVAVQNAIVAEVGKAMFGGFGVAPLPLLVGTTPATVTVPIKPMQPNTNYNAQAFATSGAAVLTTLEIVSIAKNAAADGTSSSVSVTVRNTGAASVGGLLQVHITPPVAGVSSPAPK